MKSFFQRIKLLAMGCALTVLLAGQAQAVTFNITYDASVTASTNSANIQSAFSAATQILQGLYTNNSSVNLTVYWGPFGPFTGGIQLGASSFSLHGSSGFKYPQLTNALMSSRTTVDDTNSVANLPASDPLGGSLQWLVTRPQAKALGVLGFSPNDLTTDGSVGFATNVSYTFDPTNRAVAGKYDFIGVALHEITEVMGRCTTKFSTSLVPYDLFRFTNSGARSFDANATNAYFSLDKGATSLRAFYTNQSLGDIQDWKSVGAADSYDAAVSSGKKTVLSYADLLSLDVIGYKLAYSQPRLTVTKSGTNYVLNFTNTPGTTYTVLATTNLALAFSNWPTLGTSTDSVPGQFFFTDTQAATNKLRFYRVRLN